MEFLSNSFSSTYNFAKDFAKFVSMNSILLLSGSLGSGKTSFVRGFMSNYGIENITSPSYSIINHYKSNFEFYHIDLYRLVCLEDVFEIGLDEILYQENCIILIEWYLLAKSILPKNKKLIYVDIKINQSIDYQNFSCTIKINESF